MSIYITAGLSEACIFHREKGHVPFQGHFYGLVRGLWATVPFELLPSCGLLV